MTAYEKSPPRTVADIEDGLSKTLLFTETREEKYASWYASPGFNRTDDIAYISVVAQVFPPGSPFASKPSKGSDGHIMANAPLSLNVGPAHAEDTTMYISSFHDRVGIAWGPSSEHAGGVINHVFADGHVVSVSETADPTMYFRMITYNCGEQVSEGGL